MQILLQKSLPLFKVTREFKLEIEPEEVSEYCPFIGH
jgi:hypothetical protein